MSLALIMQVLEGPWGRVGRGGRRDFWEPTAWKGPAEQHWGSSGAPARLWLAAGQRLQGEPAETLSTRSAALTSTHSGDDGARAVALEGLH